MSLSHNVIINIYSILILIIISVQANKIVDKTKFNNRLFNWMIQLNVALLFFDIMGRFDGRPDTIYPIINQAGNFLLFTFGTFLSALWLLYVHYQIFGSEERTKGLIAPLGVMSGLHFILVVLSQFFGWFYYIDENNIYHRGPYFMLSTMVTVLSIITAAAMIIAFRKKIGTRYYLSLALFAVPPLAGILLQTFIYGVSFVLNAMVLSLLIAFLYIQNKTIATDYLTGLYNRKKLERYLRQKIESSGKNRTFSAIMIDINNFKNINDNYGHEMGDKALEIAGQILKSCIRTDDFLARFGGDEFFLILDINNDKDLEAAVRRIHDKFNEFNSLERYPFRLSFSLGRAVYDPESKMDGVQFQRHVDELMYKNKEEYKKSLRRNIWMEQKETTSE